MKQSKALFIAIICVAFITKTRADSWIDPTWKRMLDSSQVIALVQYTSNGDFEASAKVLSVYKGKLNEGDNIYISGFSNRYGPINKMHKGDKYLVFLRLNNPTNSNLEYWTEKLEKERKLKGFVEALKNRQAYYVWTPTSGDLKVRENRIQYDLVQTTYYRNQDFYSLSDFEDFLRACQDKISATNFGKNLLSRMTPDTKSDLNAQTLMQLYLLGYDEFDEVFNSYVKVKNPSSKYALAMLMGNIKTEQSRNVLIALLDDKHSVVQGEVVRQLKNESTEIVAPILLNHLKLSSDLNFGRSNIMDPVMNRIDGGKVEIIRALGEFKYQPAIPDLLTLLDTENDFLFGLVIHALKDMGSEDYIPYINKHLDKKTHNLIFRISMMIAQDSLIECLSSFKNFISTCDRSKNLSYEYTLSHCCGIGKFTDSTTTAFILSDYENFFTYKDTLESSRQESWTREYIGTFKDLRIKEARPLIYKSIFDWIGFDQEFADHPVLFKKKKQLEDSISLVFKSRLGGKGYFLNHCIAFIQNTPDVIMGQKPVAKYLIEVTTPISRKGGEQQKVIASELNLPLVNVFVRYPNGIYYDTIQERFSKDVMFTPLGHFIDYAKEVPNLADINFLQSLLDYNIVTDDYMQDKVKDVIASIRKSL